MGESEISRPFNYLAAEQGWVTIFISITQPVREVCALDWRSFSSLYDEHSRKAQKLVFD
jgi:hypothetical protein